MAADMHKPDAEPGAIAPERAPAASPILQQLLVGEPGRRHHSDDRARGVLDVVLGPRQHQVCRAPAAMPAFSFWGGPIMPARIEIAPELLAKANISTKRR